MLNNKHLTYSRYTQILILNIRIAQFQRKHLEYLILCLSNKKQTRFHSVIRKSYLCLVVLRTLEILKVTFVKEQKINHFKPFKQRTKHWPYNVSIKLSFMCTTRSVGQLIELLSLDQSREQNEHIEVRHSYQTYLQN